MPRRSILTSLEVGEVRMKVFLLSSAVVVVVAIAAAVVLEGQQVTVADTFATEGARVGDPGDNLVTWR
jgi:hypothetical protein